MSHSRKHRITAGRIWVCVVFLILTGAHYLLYKYSNSPVNSFPITRGLTAGCVIWTTVLLGGMWMRYSWARYALITIICLTIIGFGILAMIDASATPGPLPHHVRIGVEGLLVYAFALFPLSKSEALHLLLSPRTAGER